VGFPGYLERAYIAWCRSKGLPSNTLVIWRTISMTNVVITAVLFKLFIT
jgi:hypothetical protein